MGGWFDWTGDSEGDADDWDDTAANEQENTDEDSGDSCN